VHFSKDAQEGLIRLDRAKELLQEITGHEYRNQRKRGVTSFIGELSKILFSTLDEDNVKYYNE
jgi:hypothetical protein